MPFALEARLAVSSASMRLSCWLSDRWPHEPHPGFSRSRVWSGPLSGCHLSMQRLERPAMLLGRYEPHVVTAMCQYVTAGSVAYDIGAHIGYMAHVLSRLVGPAGQVIAFEPDSANYAALTHNLAENRRSNVLALPLAVSDRTGSASFAHFDSYSLVGHLARSDTPGDATLLPISTMSLDNFVYEQGHPAPGFIKIDVEGAEVQVLAGARRLLSEARPVLVAELRASMKPAIVDLLLPLGYRLQVLQGTEADWSRWGLADVLLLPPDK